MASKDPDEHFNTETDEETVALRKKRLRRVSFADREITSVHIFNRDEDYETPPEGSGRKSSSEEDDRQVLGFFRDLAVDSDDSKEMSPVDDGEVVFRKSFLQPMGSPSPGSSVVGSATSNDEENFFGPVSSSFIRSGRLSDSAASDDNHDITMDSTAFSMHFRSLVRSESGDLKTPTGKTFAFEEKTPTHVSTSSDPGSFMVLTKPKKPIGQSPVAVGKVTGSRDSNDMSLVGDDSHKYDYGRLSPALEALLAESGENILVDSLFDSAADTKSLKKSEVPIFNDVGSGSLDKKDNSSSDMHDVGFDDVYAAEVPMAHSSSGESNGGSMATVTDLITHDCPSSRIDYLVSDAPAGDHIQSPNQPNNVRTSPACRKVKNPFVEGVTGTNMLNVEIPVGSFDNPPDVIGNRVHWTGLNSQHKPSDLFSPQNLLKGNPPADRTHNSPIVHLPDQHPGSPLSGSIILLSAKRKQIFLDTTITPSPKKTSSFFSKENIEVGEKVSTIQKSHLKVKISSPSAHTSVLREEIEKSKRRLSEYLSSSASPVNNFVEETGRNLQFQHVDASVMNLEKHFLSADRKNVEHAITTNMNGGGGGTPKNFGSLNQNKTGILSGGESLDHLFSPILSEDKQTEVTDGDGDGTPENVGSLNQNKIGVIKGGESLDHVFNPIPSEDKQTEVTAAAASHARLTMPGKIQHLLMSNNPMQGPLAVSVSDTSAEEITLDLKKDLKVTNDFDTFMSPPMKNLDQKLSSPAETHGSVSGNLKHNAQSRSLVDSGLDGNSIEYATSGNHLTGTVNNLDSLAVELRTNSYSPLIEINRLTDFTKVKRVDDRDIYTSALLKASETVKKFQTLSGDMNLMKFQLPTPDKNLQIANDPSLTKGELPGDKIKASTCVPTSPNILRTINEPLLLKSPTWKEPIWSPYRKEQGDSSLSTRSHFSRSGSSSKSNSDEHVNDDCLQVLYNSQNSFYVQDFDNSSRGKIRSEEIVLGDAHNAYNIGGIQKRLKVDQSGGTDLELMIEQSDGSKKGNEKNGVDATLKHWTDISLKFSAETNQILSPSIEKLNTGAIAVLEDILAHLQKIYKYEMICSEILSQKRGRLLDSKIKKFETLKLNYVRHLSAPANRDTQVDDDLHDSSFVNFGSKHEVAGDSVTRMRQENFPNMDACVAFGFLFNAESTKKSIGPKSLAQETQKTSSVLHNLLAVVEEVQLARIEIRNLIHAKFNSPSAGQLDLQLRFIDFNSCRKVTMTLDVTCLNCGVYPSEILPYHLEVSTAVMQKSLPEVLSAEIKATIGNLAIGYLRIFRLCRCVSQVLQISSRSAQTVSQPR
ncbi:hypothetical protein KPL70_004067 [Citrus sinensis]|nr:hypothetical protein KPL70_004067 [Citrus sinensis]KAH9745419.1 hypothetical protein KPL70_004067 [Citrus sinensis]